MLNVFPAVCQCDVDRKRAGVGNISELLCTSDIFLTLFKGSLLKAENNFDVLASPGDKPFSLSTLLLPILVMAKAEPGKERSSWRNLNLILIII